MLSCAMIGQSMIKIRSDGHGRILECKAAVFLILFVLFFSKLIPLQRLLEL
jgi:MFS superfamily sulfate permease-like transporter